MKKEKKEKKEKKRKTSFYNKFQKLICVKYLEPVANVEFFLVDFISVSDSII